MDRYIDVMIYLFFSEADFRKKFLSKKGFCFYHLKMVLDVLKINKPISPCQTSEFIIAVMDMQLKNMDRISEELNWFTKKFDYRYKDAPWKNSKDAVIRSIQKLTGYLRITR